MAWLAETLASNGYIVAAVKSPRQHRGRTFIPASRVHPVVGTGEGYFGPHRQVVGRPTVWCSHRPISNRSRRVLAGWVYRVGNGWRQACASAVEELLCQPASRAKLQLAPRKLPSLWQTSSDFSITMIVSRRRLATRTSHSAMHESGQHSRLPRCSEIGRAHV